MLFMVIEHIKDPIAVYRRLRDEGRSLPDGLRYISSWVTLDHARCWQLMETDDRRLLEDWTRQAGDLVEFEVVPVVTSAEAAESIAPRL